MLQDIQNRQKKRPFEHFIIRLRDGRKLTIPEPELVRVRSGNVLLYFDVKEDAAEAIQATDIVSVENGRRVRSLRSRRRK